MFKILTQTKLTILIALNIFIGAFLSFLIQPLITKKLIFEFGGIASVWNVSLAFFTTLLVGGYLYAEFLSKKSLKQILLIHAGVHFSYILFIILKLIFLPDFIKNTFAPESSIYYSLLKSLTLETAILYFATAGNSIVMQLILSRIKINENVYKFYSLSNAGSLIGLLIFPFVFEPNVGIKMATNIMYGIFIIFSLSFLLILKSFYTKTEEIQITNTNQYKMPYKVILLSFVSMSTMIATTTHLTMDLASMPLIWILPLTIYLISFIFGFFEYKKLKKTQIYTITILAVIISSFISVNAQGLLKVFVTNINLLVILTALHHIIYIVRPKQENLSKYYLAIAIGGSLASIFSAYVFPIIFNNFYEYAGFSVISILVIYYFFKYQTIVERDFGIFTLKNIVAFTLLVFATALPLYQFSRNNKNIKSSFRDFYGIAQIKEENQHPEASHRGMQFWNLGRFYSQQAEGYFDPKFQNNYKILVHNGILHGTQNNTDTKIPTTYYGKSSPLFEYFENDKTENKKILAVGLGVGTINAYCDKFSEITFLEINPKIVQIANDEFSFLKQCSHQPQILVGDARKLIETKLIPNPALKYDAIILDAFSGDNIPAHLITKEAFDLYQKLLTKDGKIFVHISNKYLDLEKAIQNNNGNLDSKKQNNKNRDLSPDETESQWITLYQSKNIKLDDNYFTDNNNSLLKLLK